MRRSNFALRLQPSLLEEALRAAEQEGVAVNQLINAAVAEKLSALRTESYFQERAGRADLEQAREVLERAGQGKPPMLGGRAAARELVEAMTEASRRSGSATVPVPCGDAFRLLLPWQLPLLGR